MQKIIFYFLYPIIYLIASTPFKILYKISDVLFLILWITQYRKKVVLENLRSSFPTKSENEIRSICRYYYRYLCDLLLEALKTMKMDSHESTSHFLLQSPEWLNTLHAEKRSIIIVMGHYGNWEWAGPAMTLCTPYQLTIIYRPLSNPYFEKMLIPMRTRFGIQVTPASQTLRTMIQNKDRVTATAFVADQYPPTDSKLWVTFLNQHTGFYTGPEKLAVKFNYPVVYAKLKRVERGKYEATLELLCENPQQTEEGEITKAFCTKLENDIIESPVTWLWSHRRWKHHQ